LRPVVAPARQAVMIRSLSSPRQREGEREERDKERERERKITSLKETKSKVSNIVPECTLFAS
jgi:hypothetical protein